MTESSYPMIAIDEALATIEREIQPLPTVTTVASEALGMILAEDVSAREAMPPFEAAAVDGYAVIAGDGPGWREIIGEQMAGPVGTEVTVTSGAAVRVTTGAPVPPGADALVMVEDTEEADGRVNIKTASIQPGAFIRPIGQDVETGQVVLPHGSHLGPAEVGLLATLGVVEVTVYRPPVVGVMSTGDELVEPKQAPLQRGQIRDANRFTLMSLVEQLGAVPYDIGIVRDHGHTLVETLEDALTQVDLLLTSGGVSMGQRDLVKPYIALRGKVHFGRVNTKPGKPVTFGVVDKIPCFALPGFPVSTMVCFEVFVRPAMLKMMGHPTIYRLRERVTLAHTFKHDGSRTEFQRVKLTRQPDGRLTAESTGFQGSGRLLSMVGANGLVILPHGQDDYEAGSEVEAMLLETI